LAQAPSAGLRCAGVQWRREVSGALGVGASEPWQSVSRACQEGEWHAMPWLLSMPWMLMTGDSQLPQHAATVTWLEAAALRAGGAP